jgi:hypothetical protein
MPELTPDIYSDTIYLVQLSVGRSDSEEMVALHNIASPLTHEDVLRAHTYLCGFDVCSPVPENTPERGRWRDNADDVKVAETIDETRFHDVTDALRPELSVVLSE